MLNKTNMSANEIHLAIRINTALMRFYRLSRTLQTLQSDIAKSLNSYYGALSDALCDHHHYALGVSREQDMATRTAGQREELELLMRQLYHKLAKAYHPDTSQKDDHVMRDINEAYEQRQLGSLMALCHNLLGSNTAAYMSIEDLQHYHRHINNLANTTQHSIHLTQQSESYLLHKRLFDAKLQGQDIIGEVAFSLKKQLQGQTTSKAYA